MAKIYAAWEGKQPIKTPPIGDLSFQNVIPLLNREQYIRSDKPETFGVQGSDPRLDDFRDASAIYIEVDEKEAAAAGWSGGWYFVMIAPSVAKKLLVL